VDEGEECDDCNNVNSVTGSERVTARVEPYCGDEKLDEGEECARRELEQR
jgi:hypothetical protein